jgi:putative SbcD/Mre11-related phosphoesterase
VVEETGTINHAQTSLELLPGVWADYRKAVYLQEEKLLCVADLHLGYAWAHRYHGQIIPLPARDQLSARLSELCLAYNPSALVILGDIVHQAVPVSAVRLELNKLLKTLGRVCPVKLVIGNHDRQLASLLEGKIDLREVVRSGNYVLVHGNVPVAAGPGEIILMGHEHPAISLGDGVVSAKFPCFLAGKNVVALPAFSAWAAGSNIRCYDFMSPLARAARFEKALAILGERLLLLPLG